ncbi:helix-turn-helix domain-containing protein [Bdellovibrionota bacterium FG-1]
MIPKKARGVAKMPGKWDHNHGRRECLTGAAIPMDAAHTLFENQILTVKEVADLLKMSTKTVYKHVRAGVIPCKKIGKEIRFLLPELLRWMKGDIYE